MPPAYENPLSGRPRTLESQDSEGRPVFTIIAQELTPGRARAATALSALAGGCLMVALPFLIARSAHITVPLVAGAVAAGIVCHRAISAAITQALHATTEIVMTTAEIAVRRGADWKRYAREIAHQFLLIPHDRTREEQRANDFGQQKASREGKAVQPAVFYGESFHVVLAYAGQRIDLLTVYRPPRAAAVVARLQLCDELLNRAAGKSHSTGGGPDSEWSRPAPGGLA